MIMTTPEPYKNLEDLDEEIDLLRLRVARHSLGRRLAEAQMRADDVEEFPRRRGGGSVPEIRARLDTVVRQEEAARANHEARLAAHRASDRLPLSLDALAAKHGLTDDRQRSLVVAVATMALGRPVAEVVMGAEGLCGSGATVGDLITHVIAPQNAAEWTQARCFFHPDSPLVKSGLFVLDEPYGMLTGETLLERSVAISVPALAMVLEEKSILSEADIDDEQDQ